MSTMSTVHTKSGERPAKVDDMNMNLLKDRLTKHAQDLSPQKQTVQYMDLDPVQSYIRMDRCGPNPNPEWCYILKTNLCQYKNSNK